MKFLLAAIIICNFNSVIASEAFHILQKDSTGKNSVENSLIAGKWSVQIAAKTDFKFSRFNGLAFSVKKNISSATAVQAGVFGNYKNDENEFQQTQEKTENAGINLSFLYYPNPGYKINFFFYSGGQFTYNYDYYQDKEIYKKTFYRNIGLIFGAGAEYFLFRQLSLNADYSYRFSFGWRNFYSGNVSVSSEVLEENESKNVAEFRSEYLKLGILFYF